MTENIKNFMIETVLSSKSCGLLCYLYKDEKGFFISNAYRSGEKWYFRAYPGGRKELSLTGKEEYLKQGFNLEDLK